MDAHAMTPGHISLGTVNVTTATTQVGDWTTVSLDGLFSLLFEVKFVYGSGGTNCKVYLQTTADDGTTPVDIACKVFTTSSLVQLLNFSASAEKTTFYTPTDATLTDDTAVGGILGTTFRLKVVSTGTYAASTSVTGHAVVR